MIAADASRPSRSWRWRRCPRCGNVERASAYLPVRYGPAWEHGDMQGVCPSCGHRAATSDFAVVREHRG